MSTFASKPPTTPRSHFFSERPTRTGTGKFKNEPLPRPRTHTLARPVSPPLVNGNRSHGPARSDHFSQRAFSHPQSFHNSSTREQNVHAIQEIHAEDVRSTTSASSKASQASRICRNCRQPAANVNPLYKCTTCHRHWHKHCGGRRTDGSIRTFATALRVGRAFICSKCPDGPARPPTGPSAKRKAEEPQNHGKGKKPRLQGPEQPAIRGLPESAPKDVIRGRLDQAQQVQPVRSDSDTESRLNELFPNDANVGVPQRWAVSVNKDAELRRCLRDVYDRAVATGKLRSLWYEEPRYLAKACEKQGYLSCMIVREVANVLTGSSARVATQQAQQTPLQAAPKGAISKEPTPGLEESHPPQDGAEIAGTPATEQSVSEPERSRSPPSTKVAATTPASEPKQSHPPERAPAAPLESSASDDVALPPEGFGNGAVTQTDMRLQDSPPEAATHTTPQTLATVERVTIETLPAHEDQSSSKRQQIYDHLGGSKPDVTTPAKSPSLVPALRGEPNFQAMTTSRLSQPVHTIPIQSVPAAVQESTNLAPLPPRASLTHQLPPRPPVPAAWIDEASSTPALLEPDRTKDLPRSPIVAASAVTRHASSPLQIDDAHLYHGNPRATTSNAVLAASNDGSPTNTRSPSLGEPDQMLMDQVSGTVAVMSRTGSETGLPTTESKVASTRSSSIGISARGSATPTATTAFPGVMESVANKFAANGKEPVSHQSGTDGRPPTIDDHHEIVESPQDAASRRSAIPAGNDLESASDKPRSSGTMRDGESVTHNEAQLAYTVPQHDGPAALETPGPSPQPEKIRPLDTPFSPMHGVDTPFSPAPSTRPDTHMDSEPPSPVIRARESPIRPSIPPTAAVAQPEASILGSSEDSKTAPRPIRKARRGNAFKRGLTRADYGKTVPRSPVNPTQDQVQVNTDTSTEQGPSPTVQTPVNNNSGPPPHSADAAGRIPLESLENQLSTGPQKPPSITSGDRDSEEPVVVGSSNSVRPNAPRSSAAGASHCFIARAPRRSSLLQTPLPPLRGQTTISAVKRPEPLSPRSSVPSNSASIKEVSPIEHRRSPQTPAQSPITPISQNGGSAEPGSNPVQANLSVVVPGKQDMGIRRARRTVPLPARKKYVDHASQTIVEDDSRPALQTTLKSIEEAVAEHVADEGDGRRRKTAAEVNAEMKDQGIIFEDSDTDDAEGNDEPHPQRPVLTLLQTKKTSGNLFDIAPSLRPLPPSKPSGEHQLSTSKKATSKNFTAHVLEQRRRTFGNDHPHRIVDSDTPELMITTTRLQDYRILPHLRYDDPPKDVKVQMSFSEFMNLPKDLVYVPQVGPKAHEQLVFREGAKDKRWLESGASRRTRKAAEQEVVYKL